MSSAPATTARDQLLARMPVTERRLELAGISTSILEAGAGPPIVLLHGPGEHGLKWFGIIAGLAATHRVIAPDLPGHGETIVRDGVVHADRVLSWLGALIDATCAEAPILVGYVLGGAIAARFAARYSQRLSRLVLVDTLGLVPFHPEPEFERAMMAFLTQPDEESYGQLWRQCTADFDSTRTRMGDSWDLLRDYNLDRARTPALQEHFNALMAAFGFPPIAPEELARISVPTALIWGRDDRATRVQVAQTVSARYRWPLDIIEHAGADPVIEQPEAFTDALRSAVRAAAASASV